MRTPKEAGELSCLPDFLAVLIVGTLARSVEADRGDGRYRTPYYPRYSRDYYDGYGGGYGAYGGGGGYPGYAGCGGYGGRGGVGGGARPAAARGRSRGCPPPSGRGVLDAAVSPP